MLREQSDVAAQLSEVQILDKEIKGFLGFLTFAQFQLSYYPSIFTFILFVKDWHCLITVILVILMARR